MSLTVPRAQFHALTIKDVRRETSDAVSLSFVIPGAFAADYAFHAGQYLTLRFTLDGEEIRRAYSICSGEGDNELRIAIKRVPDGRFSAWATENLHAGDSLDVMTPTGRFGLPADGTIYAGFAAGSGITPILSLMKTALARNSGARFFLFYGSRATDEILFRGALEDLKDRAMGRVSIFHVLSQEQQDVAVLNGRLDPAKLGPLLTATLGGVPIDHAFLCGPAGMIEAAEASLSALGVPPDHIHVERFTSVHEGRPRPVPKAPASITPFATATLILDGISRDIPVAENEALLDAALRAGLDLPYSCKGGMCSTCRAKVLQGDVAMTVNYSLEPWETKAGFVLTCQAQPRSPRVVVDFDQQ